MAMVIAVLIHVCRHGAALPAVAPFPLLIHACRPFLAPLETECHSESD
jgi:hypothetical protein